MDRLVLGLDESKLGACPVDFKPSRSLLPLRALDHLGRGGKSEAIAHVAIHAGVLLGTFMSSRIPPPGPFASPKRNVSVTVAVRCPSFTVARTE
jgi:hypothetical protein